MPGEGEHKVMDMIREQRRQEEEKQQYVSGAPLYAILDSTYTCIHTYIHTHQLTVNPDIS